MRVAVVVLGDIGRSPRMTYHASSLAKIGADVDIIAYRGQGLPDALSYLPNVKLYPLPEPYTVPSDSPRVFFLAYAPFKLLFQSLALFWMLLVCLPKLDYVLVQCPPSIPTLPILQFACLLCDFRLIIDWHNFGYSIMALNLGESHWAVKLAKMIEQRFGCRAYAHLAVTNAMAEHLRTEWGMEDQTIMTLYDKPRTEFKRLDVDEAHEFLLRVANRDIPCLKGQSDNETRLTVKNPDGSTVYKLDRPALVVSGTSWTPDEDIGIFIEALRLYDVKARFDTSLPSLTAIITGKGPQRSMYEKRIEMMDFQKCTISTAWLKIEDYPLLLGAADVGVSMHASSSKLDLPMKVVDMFGCGLPVCSVNYMAITELVKPNVTGLLFYTAEELCSCLITLLRNSPGKNEVLREMRSNVKKEFEDPLSRWHPQWNHLMSPLLRVEIKPK